MNLTIKPHEFQLESNRIRYTALKPYRNELATLPELEDKAKKAGDIHEVRRLRQRAVELHEALLSAACAGKREMEVFAEEFGSVWEAETKRADAEVEVKRAARKALETEYKERAAEMDQEIVQAEQARHALVSDLQSISEIQAATVAELAEQIDQSLKVA